MPISDFLEDIEFSQFLKESIVYPAIGDEGKSVVVPSICDNPSLVGIAFEFLLQYELLRYHIKTKSNVGVYNSRLMLGEKRPQAIYQLSCNSDRNEKPRELKFIRYIWPSSLGASKVSQTSNSEKQKIIDFYKSAERRLKEYDKDLFLEKAESIPDEIFLIALKLSKLEAFYRGGVIDSDLDYVSAKDLDDLKDLIRKFDTTKLDAERYCLCGPYFAYKGKPVSGFDMDFVLDNVIVDIKTTSKQILTKSHINQLVIYYLLSRVFGIEGYPAARRIERIAIYYARYGLLWASDIRDVLSSNGEAKLKKWIKARVASVG